MKNKINYTAIIETMFAVIIGQNTLMLSKPVVAFLANNLALNTFLIFVSVGVINTFTLIANWQQSKETENRYNKKLFVWDIFTLAEFAFFTQVLYDSFDGTKLLISDHSVLMIFAASYAVIYTTFMLWNKVSVKNSSAAERKYINKAIRLNVGVVISMVALLITLGCNLVNWQYPVFIIDCIVQIAILLYYYYHNIFG